MQRFNEETSGKNQSDGKRVLENDLVSSMNIDEKEDIISIEGTVISENLFNEYLSIIKIEKNNTNVVHTRCSCDDYMKKGLNKKNYCCKHLIALFYMALDDLCKNYIFDQEKENSSLKVNSNNILSLLLDDNKHKEEIKLEVYINRNKRTSEISAEFKIGTIAMSSAKLYVLKDIPQFLISYHHDIAIKYGNNFIFDKREYFFNVKDKKLIEFMEMIRSLDSNSLKNSPKFIEGKYMIIPSYLMREFFEKIRGHRIFLNEGFFGKVLDSEILLESPPMEFKLSIKEENFVLEYNDVLPDTFGKNRDVFLYGTTIYLPNHDFCYGISPYMKIFNNSRTVTIPKYEENTVLLELIPKLNTLSYNLHLSNDIRNRIVMEPVKFKFYMDREDEDILVTLKVAYGIHEFNLFHEFKQKVIYREYGKEERVIEVLRSLGFEKHRDKFVMTYGDDFKFNFLRDKLKKLQDIGEVYYSENFKGIKSIGSKSIKSEIKAGKHDYFEMTYKIATLNVEETANILRAFRDNLKYYKLKSGEFIDLGEDELQMFLKLLDSVAPQDLESENIEISNNRALFINEYIKKNKIRYIKGTKELKDISSRFNEISKLKFDEPEYLRGILRSYQKVGFNWFKTLDYLGFGGILGDEMGLGKTLQTIAFISSNSKSKSLIVAPTSLLYNWSNEFKKFAPNIKVAICNGTIEERQDIIRKYIDYDVIITTYNLLKRDLDKYENISFDYCILDEAQFIKNPYSQNAMAVKQIKCKNRFALTGTPIENSLMELWSIFDFIMPGYLYDIKRFSVRYDKRLKESPEVIDELNNLIKPFILRRKKKDVVKELPNKIENHLMVSLAEEQKKVYSTYAKYANELIEKKVKDFEFKKDKIEILSYITKLRQLCLDPSVVMNDYVGESGKIEALVELLHNSIEEGHRILVFSQFTSVLKNIGTRLNHEDISFNYLDGSMSSQKRIEEVNEFNNGNTPVFLISLKAGGTGLNLTSADIVVHFDPWWNPAVEDQATDRAHRIGQKKVVEVIKIVARGSIEEKIIALQEEKRNLIGKLMDNEDYSGNTLMTLSDDEILELFKYEE